MLSIFRKGVTSKIMLVILAIGLFAIVATGFGADGSGLGGLSGGAGGGQVAEVDGEAITVAEVSDLANRQLALAREQQPELDMPAFVRQGAIEEIVDQLITQRALIAFAREQGLNVSKAMVDAEIARIPAFRNLAGQFDPEALRRTLAAENITEQQLREDLTRTLLQRQMLLPIAGSPKVSDEMARQYSALLLEQRSGTVGLVPTEAMGAGTPPTDAEVTAFYRENVARYTIPERRVIRYALIGPDQVPQGALVTDAEIQAAYNQASDRYGAKESRALRQVVLPDEAQARAFATKIAGGVSFAQAAQQAGFSAEDTRVEADTREALATLASPEVAAAAYGAAQGAVTAPTRSPLGWHVVFVEGVTRRAATPLAAVRAEIEREIAIRKRGEAMSALVTRVEDAIGEGGSLTEVAKANGLQVQETPPLTAGGLAPGNAGFQIGPLAPAVKTAFEMNAEEDPVVETLQPNERFALMQVGRVAPAAAPALTQIAPRVRADLVARRARERARAVATAIVAKINAGTAPAEAFREAQMPLPPVQSLTARRIEIARPDQPVPPPLLMMFSLPEGKARLLAAPDGGGWFVVHHQNRVPGNAAEQPRLIEATRTQFERVLGEEYADQFGRAVQAAAKVERDPEAIRTLRRQLAGPGATQ